MTQSYVRHDWVICMCANVQHVINPHTQTHTHTHTSPHTHKCPINTHSYVWHDSIICVTWLSHMYVCKCAGRDQSIVFFFFEKMPYTNTALFVNKRERLFKRDLAIDVGYYLFCDLVFGIQVVFLKQCTTAACRWKQKKKISIVANRLPPTPPPPPPSTPPPLPPPPLLPPPP